MTRHTLRFYSGPASRPFWKRVKRLRSNPEEWGALYDLGVKLQNLEEEAAKRLRAAECKKKQKFSESGEGK